MASNPSRPGTPSSRPSTGTQTDRHLSIYQALSRPLPALKTVQGWVERPDTHYSSTATEITHPPAFWEEVPMSTYVQKADQTMGKPAVQYLHGHSDPGPDPLARMRSEADVVRYSDEQLVFHVNHALYACFGNKIESYGEYEFDRCRPDKAWKLAAPTNGSKKTFAVFESKIKATIKLDELDRAKLKTGEDPNVKIRDAADLEKETHFMGKSLKIMSQAAKYSRNATFNTNYVALFDADYLFLCVFNRANPRAMHATLVPCGQDNARKALLGWLIAAYEAEMAGTNGRAPPHPGDSGGNRQTRSSAAASKTGQQPPAAPGGGQKPPSAGQGSSATMPRGGSSAAAPPKSGTAVASKPSRSSATLPTRPKKQEIDPRTKKPIVDAKGNPIYE